MGLNNRIGAIAKSQFNHWVTKAEDPLKIINQVVQEMDEGLERSKGKLEQLKLRIKEQDRFLSKFKQQISYLEEKAVFYVEKGMEENAKDAIRKKRVIVEDENRLKVKQNDEKRMLSEVESTLKELEARVQMAKVKRKILFNNFMLDEGAKTITGESKGFRRNYDTAEQFSVFSRMEERIEDEVEYNSLKREQAKEHWEKQEKLVNEELEQIKKDFKKGGNKK